MKEQKKSGGETSVDPLVNALNDKPEPTPSSGLGVRLVVAILLLGALAALVYKQSF